jgi:hypothetical protein
LNSGSRDLWLSATGAVLNGGCRPCKQNAASGNLFRAREPFRPVIPGNDGYESLLGWRRLADLRRLP